MMKTLMSQSLAAPTRPAKSVNAFAAGQSLARWRAKKQQAALDLGRLGPCCISDTLSSSALTCPLHFARNF